MIAFRLRIVLWLAVGLWAAAGAASAQKAQFDLSGPTLQVQVTRAGVTLPIAQAPGLAAGDRIHIQADLPAGQGARYLLMAGFLRGATDPPPKSWFFAAPTWTAKGKGGLDLVVPSGAQQALVFLAPHTGGDAGTLSGAVRARPGVFVRAAQDLGQLDLDRARMEAFLEGVRQADRTHPETLEAVSGRLARSLGIKVDQACFAKAASQQAACLLQDQSALLLDDGHSISTVQNLASGATADLVTQLGGAQPLGGGVYSPYVGAVMDIVRILDGMHTAHFQYIPALAVASGDRLALRLNAPPSFGDPKSVLVVALPAVGAAPVPSLRAVDAASAQCLARREIVLPVEGAPLVFATELAHGLTLQLKTRDGGTVDLPVRADAARGGLVADGAGLDVSALPPALDGVLHGRWGFAAFEGPSFRLEAAQAGLWRLADDDGQALIVGRSDTLKLTGGAADCVESVKLALAGGDARTLAYKVAGRDGLTITAPLADATPGEASLIVVSTGGVTDRLAVRTYAQAGRLDRFVYHAGDASGLLQGARLDEVAALTLGGASFRPGALTSIGPADTLELTAAAPPAGDARPGAKAAVRVTLADGRTERLETVVLPPRPQIAVTALTQRPGPATTGDPVALGDEDEAPGGAVLVFTLAPVGSGALHPHETVEVATGDGAYSARLSGPSVVLADPHAAVITLDTAKDLDPSAYGPLRVRIADDRGESDWQPLATLVRLPHVDAVSCKRERPTCKLEGQSLFLISALSADPTFADPVSVPDGFPGQSLDVPHPRNGRLYIKLHDDPTVVSILRTASLPAPPTR
jgi:hypothetical protein